MTLVGSSLAAISFDFVVPLTLILCCCVVLTIAECNVFDFDGMERPLTALLCLVLGAVGGGGGFEEDVGALKGFGGALMR